VVTGDGLGPHRAEVVGETGPELLQAHVPTLARPRRVQPSPAGDRATRTSSLRPASTYPGVMGPWGSPIWDLITALGIVLALILLIRGYRGR
jgi:hypothetical protein